MASDSLVGLGLSPSPYAELRAKYDVLSAEYAVLRTAYYELLYGVAKKWPNETRHETALRYIRAAEQEKECAAKSGSK